MTPLGRDLVIKRLEGASSPFPLWLVDTSRPPSAKIEALLSPAELGRAQRFQMRGLRDRYVAAHGALRLVLDECFGVPAVRQIFACGPQGKPYLVGFPRVQFNLSYSEHRVLIGAAEVPIGVDIERLRPVDGAGDLAASFYTAAERRRLDRCRADSARFDHLFLETWARKEACVKAAGVGIARISLSDIETGAGNGLKAVRVGFCQLRTDTTLVEDGFVAAWAAGNVPVSA